MLQSAMEYLMTYGWAILAIAIVMVSLYSLGIFNTGSLQPTATPGSCEIVRTAAQTSLAGQCSNLVPKYVGQFVYNSGNPGYIVTDTANLPTGSLPRSVFAWVYFTGNPSISTQYTIYGYGLYGSTNNGTAYIRIEIKTFSSPTQVELFTVDSAGNCGPTLSASTFANRWVLVGYTYSSAANVTVYYGTSNVTCSMVLPLDTLVSGVPNPSVIGALGNGHSIADSFNGLISNVQVYNTSLDYSSVKELYNDGIGGIPVDVRHIVGWWPLNGNANDYSGNNNQGTPTNVIWNANWQPGYTAPTT